MTPIVKNSIANYVGQVYVIVGAFIGIPIYLKYLGAEAYGLVGFLMMAYVWMNLLDIGLSPTLGRIIAYDRGQGVTMDSAGRLAKTIEVVLGAVVVTLFLAAYAFNDVIFEGVFNSSALPRETVLLSFMLIGLILTSRLFSSLFKGNAP